MLLIQVVLVLIVIGVVLWLVNLSLPIQKTIKSILNSVVLIAVLLWLLNFLGVFEYVLRIRAGS